MGSLSGNVQVIKIDDVDQEEQQPNTMQMMRNRNDKFYTSDPNFLDYKNLIINSNGQNDENNSDDDDQIGVEESPSSFLSNSNRYENHHGLATSQIMQDSPHFGSLTGAEDKQKMIRSADETKISLISSNNLISTMAQTINQVSKQESNHQPQTESVIINQQVTDDDYSDKPYLPQSEELMNNQTDSQKISNINVLNEQNQSPEDQKEQQQQQINDSSDDTSSIMSLNEVDEFQQNNSLFVW